MFDVVTSSVVNDSLQPFGYSKVVATPALMMSLTLIAVLLRCWVKKRMLNMFRIDDWLLVLAQFLYTFLCATTIYAASIGFGKHSNQLSDDHLYYIYLVSSQEVALRLKTSD